MSPQSAQTPPKVQITVSDLNVVDIDILGVSQSHILHIMCKCKIRLVSHAKPIYVAHLELFKKSK